jgi:hypothetical protein
VGILDAAFLDAGEIPDDGVDPVRDGAAGRSELHQVVDTLPHAASANATDATDGEIHRVTGEFHPFFSVCR